MNRTDHYIKSTSPTHIYDFSAEEEHLYARRLEEGYGLTDPKYEAWLNIHHPNQTKPLSPFKHQSVFSAEEEALYARRFEEAYDLTDPKYEVWLSVHHPIAAATSDTMTPVTGLHVSSSVTCADGDIPVVSPTTSCLTSTIPSSQTDHTEAPTQPVTPVHQVIRPNPTQLK